MRFMIIDTCEIIINNHTCEIIDFTSGGKISKTLYFIYNKQIFKAANYREFAIAVVPNPQWCILRQFDFI